MAETLRQPWKAFYKAHMLFQLPNYMYILTYIHEISTYLDQVNLPRYGQITGSQ